MSMVGFSLQELLQFLPASRPLLAGDEYLATQQPGLGMVGIVDQGQARLPQGRVEVAVVGQLARGPDQRRHRFAGPFFLLLLFLLVGRVVLLGLLLLLLGPQPCLVHQAERDNGTYHQTGGMERPVAPGSPFSTLASPQSIT